MKTNNYVVAFLMNENDMTISVTARDVTFLSSKIVCKNNHNYLLHNNEYYFIASTNLSMRQAKQLKASIIDLYLNKFKFTIVSAKLDNKSSV